MSIQYRQIHQNEIGFLREMLYEALFVPEGKPKFPKNIIDSLEIAKYVSDWGSSEGDVAIVAIKDKQKIGAIWGRVFSKENKGYGFVNEQTPEICMAVLKDYRNQGIGKKLIGLIEKEYRNQGVDYVALSVDKLNPAKRLYERNGYKFHEECGTAVTLKKLITKPAENNVYDVHSR